jgi:hypothetical protein
MVSVKYPAPDPKAALAIITIKPCSLRLKGLGLRDHLRPKVENVQVGIVLYQPTPSGYATSWTTMELTVSAGARKEKSELRPDAIVVRKRPITQARMVLAGKSSS